MTKEKKVLRFYDLLFLIGAAIFFCSLALGIAYTLDKGYTFPSIYDNYLAQADYTFFKRDFGLAAERYRVASEINREDPMPLIKLGLCLEMTKQKDAAKVAYDRAIKLRLAADNHYKPERIKRREKKVQ